jgi:hypothetical protein
MDLRLKITTYKYSDNGKGPLFEAIIFKGQPCFVYYDAKIDNVQIVKEIGEPFRILQAPEPSEYSYPPYEFKDEDELLLTFLEAKEQNLDTLYEKALSMVTLFNDQDDHKLKTIASDVIWSYFQDRFATTRYEVLTGGVGSGKSALAATYGAIGYRPVNTTNPTPAVIYRLLGNTEPGQCTLILEEAEKIDQNYEMMAVLKTGYTRDGKVDRTNPITLKPEFFNSYCFKIIVAERSPNPDTGKGVVDRSFVHSCFKGFPQLDIKEILNPTNTGGPEHQALRKRMKRFRNVLMMYRLIHFKDEIPDIDIGIIGRDKELIKPTLQLFHQNKKSQDELVETFQIILDLKNRRKATSLHSALLDVVYLTVPQIDSPISNLDGHAEISVKDYWAKLPERIEGQQDDKKPGEYHSEVFGTLHKGTVGRILHDNFGIESKHGRNGNRLIVNLHTIRRLRNQQNNTIEVNGVKGVKGVKACEGSGGDIDNNNSNESERENIKTPVDFLSSPPSPEREKGTPLPQLPSPPSPPSQVTCPDCGEQIDPDPYYAKFHECK